MTASAEVLNLVIDAVDQPSAPLTFRISSVIRGQFEQLGNRLAGTPGLGLERTIFDIQPMERRHAPFEISAPVRLERTITIVLPTGFRTSARPVPERNVQNEFIRSSTIVEALASGWRVNSMLYEPAQRRPAGDYNRYRAALREAASSFQPRLVAERLGP